MHNTINQYTVVKGTAVHLKKHKYYTNDWYEIKTTFYEQIENRTFKTQANC